MLAVNTVSFPGLLLVLSLGRGCLHYWWSGVVLQYVLPDQDLGFLGMLWTCVADSELANEYS